MFELSLVLKSSEIKANLAAGALWRRAQEDQKMTNRKITTNSEWYREEIAPIYRWYDGQSSPQPAYLELLPEEWRVAATYNAEIGNAVPFAVWYNRQFRISLPYNLSGHTVANLLEDENILSLVNMIFTEYQEKWDGNNHVGILSDKAQEALEELEQEIISYCDHWDEEDYVSIYYVCDWVDESDLVTLTRDTLKEVASRVEADAKADRVLLKGDVEEFLHNYLKEKEEAEGDED